MEVSNSARGTALDLFFPEDRRHPYYIVAPPYTRFSAGIRVLHTLCHALNLRGQAAFVITAKVNENLATPRLTEEVVDVHFTTGRTPIVVYPERLNGNPLRGACVVRYLLNIPGLLGVDGAFGPDDVLFWYAEQYRRACRGSEPILQIPTSNPLIFAPPANGMKRHGSCFYAGKYRQFSGEALSSVTANSQEIAIGGNGEKEQDIADLLRRSEVFYTYENTALALEATLCGCPSIVLTSKFTPAPAAELLRSWPGLGWDTDPDALEWAKSTVHEARVRYAHDAETALQQLDKFISLTQSVATTRPYREKISFQDPHVPPAMLPPLTVRRRCKNAAKAFLGRLQ